MPAIRPVQKRALNDNRRMLARLSAFVIWALIAATVVFWLLRLGVHARPAPSHGIAVADPVGGGDLTRLLGSPPAAEAPRAAAAPEAASRFRLLGIMAPKQPGTAGSGARGVALIAVDGKPPRAYPVGSHVDADLILQSVSLRTVSIGSTQGTPSVVLEIPRLPAASTGSLPAFGGAPAAIGAPPMPATGPIQLPAGAPGIGLPQGPVPAAGTQTQ
jgi:general secretion pathway protein C